MTWDDVLPLAVERADRLRPVFDALLGPVGDLLTVKPAAVLTDPAGSWLHLAAAPDDFPALKTAVLGVVPHALLSDEPAPADAVKVAQTRTLRYLTDAMQLTPGDAPGGSGLPTAPSPLASTVAGALLLGGLGYAGGRLVKRLLPEGYGDELGRTGLLAGAALGAAPGLAWMAGSAASGHGPLDAWPHRPPGTPQEAQPAPGEKLAFLAKFAFPHSPLPPELTGVYVPGLERFLAAPDADPHDAALTAAAVAAAANQPGPAAPGYVTAEQFGRLAAATAGDYASGLLVGAALNKLVGTPYSAPALGATAAGLGLAARVVPPLFGHPVRL